MAIKFESINKEHKAFIEAQKMFVIGSAGAKGFINVSPKGMDSFRIVDENTVVWLNFTGSGNETSAHVQENGRMTVMFNSFDKAPLILKLYGMATVIHRSDTRWDEMSAHFEESVATRQFFEMKVELVLTSCGYAVPRYEFTKERDTLKKWSDKKGREGIEAYWEENNTHTLDAVDTKIMQKSFRGTLEGVKMQSIFHLAYNVTDLEETRVFYRDVLGCKEGRSTKTWVDFNFFGHQISMHLGEPFRVENTGKVGKHLVSMPHLGVALQLEDWKSIAKRLEEVGTEFIIKPVGRFLGEAGEQYTMFFNDPSGNPIEIKGFESLDRMFDA